MAIDLLPPQRITLRDCLLVASEATGAPVLDLLSERRAFALPRQIVMWLARQATLYSLPRIGRYLRRDHTTVLYAVRRIERLREKDAGLRRLTDDLLHRLRAGLDQAELPL